MVVAVVPKPGGLGRGVTGRNVDESAVSDEATGARGEVDDARLDGGFRNAKEANPAIVSDD